MLVNKKYSHSLCVHVSSQGMLYGKKNTTFDFNNVLLNVEINFS